MTEREFSHLWTRYLEGERDPEIIDRLATALRDSPELLKRCADDVRVAGMLRQLPVTEEDFVRSVNERLRAVSDTAGREAMVRRVAARSRRSRTVKFIMPFAAAAGIAAAIAAGWLMVDGLWFMGEGDGRKKAQKVGVVIARVEAVSGKGQIVRAASGKRPRDEHMAGEAARAGMEIREGDRIEVGSDGRLKLRYFDDNTTIELSESSKLSVFVRDPSDFASRPEGRGLRRDTSVPGGKRLLLQRGKLTATVAKQPEGQTFSVETPHAKIAVLGTRFTVRIQDSERPIPSSAFGSTWLHVDEGLVRFTRLADGKAIEVAAGKFAVAGASAEDFALKAYAAGTEWVDGPVIFRDDFRNGLGQWNATCITATGPFVAVNANEGKGVWWRSVMVTVDGEPVWGLEIDTSPVRDGDRGYVIESNIDSIQGSYEVTFDILLVSCPNAQDVPFSAGTRLRKGTWHKIRQQFIVVQRKGAAWERVSKYFDGKKYYSQTLKLRGNRQVLIVFIGPHITRRIANVVVTRLGPSSEAGK